MNNIRALSLEVGNGDIWIEKVKIETTRQNNLEELLSQNTPIATILEFIQQTGEDENTLQELLAQFQDIQHALPIEIRNDEVGFDFSDARFIKERLRNVEDLILYYLSETEVEA
jgi:hypothetical protein